MGPVPFPCRGSRELTLGVVVHCSHAPAPARHRTLAEMGTKHAAIPPHRFRRRHGNSAEKKSDPPRHSTHALASMVKHLKSPFFFVL